MARTPKVTTKKPSGSGSSARDVEDARRLKDNPLIQPFAEDLIKEDKQSTQQLPKAAPKPRPKPRPMPPKPLPKPKP